MASSIFETIVFSSKLIKKFVISKYIKPVKYSKYNWGAIEQSAILSSLAYKDPNPFSDLKSYVKDTYSERAYQNIEHLLDEDKMPVFIDAAPAQDAQSYVWFDEKHRKAFVVFRGTESKKDILADMDIRHTKLDNMPKDIRVHRGFYKQMRSLVPSLTDLLDEKKSSYDSVVFCGHSLGGALATLAVVMLDTIKDKNISCITFGSPRVGNSAFARMFNANVSTYYRIFNENDPISMVPFSYRFEHTGEGICINDDLQLCRMESDIPWWLRKFAIVSDVDVCHLIAEHACDVYIQRTDKLNFENKQEE